MKIVRAEKKREREEAVERLPFVLPRCNSQARNTILAEDGLRSIKIICPAQTRIFYISLQISMFSASLRLQLFRNNLKLKGGLLNNML